MPNFDTAHVKNIVLLGHAGSGKTTLAECMLFEGASFKREAPLKKEIPLATSTN
jgi:elongation factor G